MNEDKKITYDTIKIKSIMREIDAIDGVIDENKKEELNSSLIKVHNGKFYKNKTEKIPSRKTNNKNRSKANDEFKKKLKVINHIIDNDEKIKLNPDNNSRYNALIEVHNLNYIKNEKIEISKEFNSDLKKFTKVIDEKEIEKFKIKYTKEYYDFFTALNMEKSIDKYNKNLEKKQKAEVLTILRQKYSSTNSPVSKEIVSDLISKYPEMDWDKLIRRYNKQYFNNKYSKTEDNVFYLNDYVRKDDWEYVEIERANTSKEILKYKDGVSRLLNKFTDEITAFIEDFSNYEVDSDIERIFLVSIPSSTPERNKKSSMKKTIKIIENKYKDGLINIGVSEIINFSNALVRIEDVK